MKGDRFIFGLILGISIAMAFSILAWQNPTQNPPQANGALYINGQNLITDKSLWIQNNNLTVGNDGTPSGIKMYDTNGSVKCLTINNDTIVVTSSSNCP